MYLPEQIKYTLTPSSGTIAQTIPAIKGKRLKKIYINPATSTTEYTLTLTEKNGEVFYTKGRKGKYTDSTIDEWCYGNITLTLSGASADEAFVVLLTFIEEAY